jgi:hypothetical protein
MYIIVFQEFICKFHLTSLWIRAYEIWTIIHKAYAIETHNHLQTWADSRFLLANYFSLFILLFPFSPIETPKLCYVCSLWHLHSLHPQHFAFVPCIFGQLTLIFHLFLHFPLLFLICILLFFLIVNLHWFSSCDFRWGVNGFFLCLYCVRNVKTITHRLLLCVRLCMRAVPI